MFPKFLSYLFLFYLFCNPCIETFAQKYGVSFKVSTLGLSLEGIRSFGDQLNARAGLSFFTINMNGGGEGDDYSYDAKLKLLTFSALADWFPFDFNMRVTGGIFINLNKGDITLRPSKSHTVGGTIYTPEMLGSLSASVDVNLISPYLGIGFGNRLLTEGLYFTLDAGAIYQGAPKVDLSAMGLLEPSAEQQPIIEDNIKWFKFYPILSFGLTYNFN